MIEMQNETISNYKTQGLNVFYIPQGRTFTTDDWEQWTTKKNMSVISPNGNIGIICGKMSENLMVLDIRQKDMCEKVLPNCFKDTMVVQTATGGYHIYLKLPRLESMDGKKVSSITVRKESFKVDLKVDGYVIGAGSVDSNGREYKVVSETTTIMKDSPRIILDNLNELGFKDSSLMGFKSATSLKQSENRWRCVSCWGEKDIIGKSIRDPVFDHCKQMKHDIEIFGDPDAVIVNDFISETQTQLRRGVKEENIRDSMREWNVQNGSEIDDVTFENKIGEVIDTWNSNRESTADEEVNEDGEDSNQKFAQMVMEKYTFKCMDDNHDLLYYDNGIYVYNNKKAESLISAECERIVPNATIKKINEIIAIVKRKNFVDRKWFDRDADLINCVSGIVNIQNGEVLPHTVGWWKCQDCEWVGYTAEERDLHKDVEMKHHIINEGLYRSQIPVEYNKNYQPPAQFLEFLKVSIGDWKQTIQIIESMASCLLRTSAFEKAFMHIGSGSNGKSTFLSLLEKMLGRHNVSHVSPHQLERERFATADLEGKMLNVYADIVSETLTSTGKLKMVISGDEISGERKHRDAFNFKPYAKLMFSANQLPVVEDETTAMYRRWFIFKWDQKFEGANQDRFLIDKLTTPEELSNLFSMLVEVAKSLANNNYKFRYEPTAQEIKDSWLELADPIEKFIDERTTKMSSGYTMIVKLYNSYQIYCKEKGLVPKTQKYFYQKFSSITGIDKTQKRSGDMVERVYEGIVLNDDLIEDNTSKGQGTLFEGDDG